MKIRCFGGPLDDEWLDMRELAAFTDVAVPDEPAARVMEYIPEGGPPPPPIAYSWHRYRLERRQDGTPVYIHEAR